MPRTLRSAARRHRRRAAQVVGGALTALFLAVTAPSGAAVAATGSATATHSTAHRIAAHGRHTARPKAAAKPTEFPKSGKDTAAGRVTKAPKKSAPVSAARLRELRAKASVRAAATADDSQASDCGGDVTFGAVYSCEAIEDGGTDTYTITTTADNDVLIVQLTGNGDLLAIGAGITDANGHSICSVVSSAGPQRCDTGAAGTYTLTVEDQYGTGGYTFAVSSLRAANCPALADTDLAFGAPAQTGSIPAGGASACYGITSSAANSGDLLRIGGVSYELRATVYDASGEVVCDVGQYGDLCTLTGTGPYVVVLTDTYAAAVSYEVDVTRISHPTGCDTLVAASFGDPGQDVMAGTLPVGAAQCRLVTLPVGPLAVSEKDGTPISGTATWTLYTADGRQTCTGDDDGTCDTIPDAGTYTLVADNTKGFSPATYTLALHPLSSTDGCASTTGTSYDLPLLHGDITSPVQADCQPFTGSPGDRVDVSAQPRTSVVDRSGAAACTRTSDQDGCVLTGAGPYRVITYGDGSVGTYTMRVARLSDPTGCTPMDTQTYGAVPMPSTDPCWLVTVPAAGTYDVGGTRVYQQDGKRACDQVYAGCAITAAGTYALVFRPSHLDDSPYTPVFVSRTETRGCAATADTDFADGAQTGSITGAGETDCLMLATPSGAGVYVIDPQVDGELDPDTRIVDATGAQQCDAYTYEFQECALTGQAPFRVLLQGDDGATGPYALTINRTDTPTGCADFPQSPFGDTYGASVTLTDTEPFRCLSIGAGEHTASELFDYTDTTNTATASLYLADASGRQLCASYAGLSSSTFCPFTPGTAYTAVLVGNPGADTYHLVHRDVGPTADCSTPASTAIGGRPTSGTLDSPIAAHCVRVSAASASDHLWLSTAGTGLNTELFVTDAHGAAVCSRAGAPCTVSGSTAYQAIITAYNYSGAPLGYRLDSWRLTVNGAFPSQCPALTAGPAGVGPFTGSLDTDHPAACALIPVKPYENLTVSGLVGRSTSVALQVHLMGADGSDMCWTGVGADTAQCQVPYNYAATTAMAVVDLAPGVSEDHFVLSARCVSFCQVSSDAPTVTAVSPAHAVSGTTTSVTVTGTGFRNGDRVWLTRSGAAPVAGKVTDESGGTSLQVSFDLDDVNPGDWSVRVTAPTGAAAELAGFTVDPEPPSTAHRA